jgi:hypothetical protein
VFNNSVAAARDRASSVATNVPALLTLISRAGNGQAAPLQAKEAVMKTSIEDVCSNRSVAVFEAAFILMGLQLRLN